MVVRKAVAWSLEVFGSVLYWRLVYSLSYALNSIFMVYSFVSLGSLSKVLNLLK